MGVKCKIKVQDMVNYGAELELDLSKFIELTVGTQNIKDSNLFLNSLWREFNLELSPNEEKRCPWAYLPQKVIIKQTSITYFGSMRTKIGYVHVAISYKIKGNIDNIYFLSDGYLAENQFKSLLKSFIKRAKKNFNLEYKYCVTYELIGRYETNTADKILNQYNGEYFEIVSKEDTSEFTFIVAGQDLIDAQRISETKIRHIVNFLAIETNIYFEHSIINILLLNDQNYKTLIQVEKIYQKDISVENDDFVDENFVDFYPAYNNKILLSIEGIKLIDRIINENIDKDNSLSIFLNGCYHFREWLERQYTLDVKPFKVFKETVISLSKINEPKKQGILDSSITLYLSAIETVTLIDNKTEKCSTCGQVKYHINKRVCEFINRYVWETHGDLFQKIYDLRSKYLHCGESITVGFTTYIRPLLDDKTGTGCVDRNFITMNVKGHTVGFTVHNVRDWTGYGLRNYYKQNLL